MNLIKTVLSCKHWWSLPHPHPFISFSTQPIGALWDLKGILKSSQTQCDTLRYRYTHRNPGHLETHRHTGTQKHIDTDRHWYMETQRQADTQTQGNSHTYTIRRIHTDTFTHILYTDRRTLRSRCTDTQTYKHRLTKRPKTQAQIDVVGWIYRYEYFYFSKV